MLNREEKITLLKEYSTNQLAIDHIISYCENKFNDRVPRKTVILETGDDLSVKAWSAYGKEAKIGELFQVLRSRIVQFMFPIRKDVSTTKDYQRAIRQGVFPSLRSEGLQLNQPELLELKIHSTLVGKIPILIIPDREDFKNITRALLYKNEPVEIPDSMGAVMIAGINNWDRIHQYKEDWLLRNPTGDWMIEFKTNVIPVKPLYQDKLILLGKSFYSNVSNLDLGLKEKEWLNYSLQIRLEHECAHFFTKHYFGCMNNNMHDELLADYMGISKVLGKFNAKWFYKFIGLDENLKYRKGGRLENYIDKDWIGRDEFKLLSIVVYRASLIVERFDNILGSHETTVDRISRLLSICSVDLITMSTHSGLGNLLTYYKEYSQALQNTITN